MVNKNKKMDLITKKRNTARSRKKALQFRWYKNGEIEAQTNALCGKPSCNMINERSRIYLISLQMLGLYKLRKLKNMIKYIFVNSNKKQSPYIKYSYIVNNQKP